MEAEISLCKICPSSSKIDETSEKFVGLKNTLPPGYQYCLCVLHSEETSPCETSLRLKIATEKEAKSWLKQYQNLSRTTWRIKCTYPHTGRKLTCRLERMCHHNTRVKPDPLQNRRTKNTNCPACLNIRVKKVVFHRGSTGQKRKCRSTDPHLPDWPTTLTFSGEHNHPIDDPSILSHRDVSNSVKMKFINLFQDGLSVTDALKLHKRDLAREHGDDYDKIVTDRHFCPDAQFCYRLYYDIFRKDTKSVSRQKVQKLLEERIAKYNDENGVCICSQTVNGEEVIAVATPLMKRVHNILPSSGEMVFVDNFASGPGCPQLLLLLTDSFAGGLPLGCLIVRSESTDAIQCGFQMLHKLIGVGAYHGRGRVGPKVFLTSNSEDERSALSQMYPSAKQVLCIFHILQAFWLFLFGDENHIVESDKYYLFQQMKALAYCSRESELQAKFESITNDSRILKYSFVVSHFNEVFERRMLWALFHVNLEGCPFSSNPGDNVCKAMSVLKDRPFERLKSPNTFQLLDLVISRVNGLCKNRLEDLVAGKFSKVLTSRYGHIQCLSAFNKEYITEESPLVFTMPRKQKSSLPRVWVDMDVGFCSCDTGIRGGPCKHQYILIRYFNIKKWKFDHVSTDVSSKKLMITLSRGDTLSELDQLFGRFKRALQRDPSRFSCPLGSFVLKWAHCETDDELIEALQGFRSRPIGESKRKNRGDLLSTEGVDRIKRARVEGHSHEAGRVESQDTSKVTSTSETDVERDAPLSEISSEQTNEETGVAASVLESTMDVVTSSQDLQRRVPIVESVTNDQSGTLPSTSVEHEALSGLASMAEQAQKLVKTAIIGCSLSSNSSTGQVVLEQSIGNHANESNLEGFSEPVIVELVTLS